MNYDEVEVWLRALQDTLCAELAAAGGEQEFRSDDWERPGGGGGVTRVLEDGIVIEKAAVNFSAVGGEGLPPAASAQRPELAGRSFRAVGVSVIVHPRNPYVPTSHFNLRFFLASRAGEADVWWFGGGFDLTPYYGFDEDCVHWHRNAQAACAPYGNDLYPRFKRWCDQYFYIRHRREARGVGGLFFDDYDAYGDFYSAWDFGRSVGEHYLKGYLPILERRKYHPWGRREREWQLYRRGRYVEFNLIYDRGTLFGLQSAGRAESILASLPPELRFRYDRRPGPGSPEARLMDYFLEPRDWLGAGDRLPR